MDFTLIEFYFFFQSFIQTLMFKRMSKMFKKKLYVNTKKVDQFRIDKKKPVI